MKTRKIRIDSEVSCGACGLLYTVVKAKDKIPKSFICPACHTGQLVYLDQIQYVHARGRNYPEGYFDS